VVATLDRNGLRPARYLVTKEGHVVLASESGVLDIPGRDVVRTLAPAAGPHAADRSRRRPDYFRRRDQGIAGQLQPLWPVAGRARRSCSKTCPRRAAGPKTSESLLDRQQAFGYTTEDVKLLMAPMATTGQEAVGSMGTDTPISALSDKSKLLYTYFKQNFAQVTNPPIDPIREESVMSLVSFIGPRPNLFDLKGSRPKSALKCASRS
jgi:glutamate synthase (NADPH/NADH) large chain